jgi:amino acid transporter
MTLLLMMSINFFDENPHDNPLNEIIYKKTDLIGLIFLIISMIALKVNAAQGSSLYSGSSLEPLAQEGYISKKLTKLNRDNLPIRASLFNTLITAILASFFLILPFLSQGNATVSDVFGFIAIISIIIHMFVLLATFKFCYQKVIKVR